MFRIIILALTFDPLGHPRSNLMVTHSVKSCAILQNFSPIELTVYEMYVINFFHFLTLGG